VSCRRILTTIVHISAHHAPRRFPSHARFMSLMGTRARMECFTCGSELSRTPDMKTSTSTDGIHPGAFLRIGCQITRNRTLRLRSTLRIRPRDPKYCLESPYAALIFRATPYSSVSMLVEVQHYLCFAIELSKYQFAATTRTEVCDELRVEDHSFRKSFAGRRRIHRSREKYLQLVRPFWARGFRVQPFVQLYRRGLFSVRFLPTTPTTISVNVWRALISDYRTCHL
jgi:hypothetical protein